MRVNIQYTVELEQIPKEMDKLLKHSVIEKLRKALSDFEAVCLEDASSVESISNMRTVLYQADERLSDVDAIIRGYYSQKMQPEGPAHQEVPMPVDSSTNLPVDPETMADVKARLSAHKLETDALKRTFQNWSGDSDEEEPPQ